MSSQFSGPSRKLYAQARILDYLAGLLSFVLSEKSAYSPSVPDKKIELLHQYLINLEGRIPTLTELSNKFGISARRLNTDFMAKYRQSIYSFITDHRLIEARAALACSSVPLKILAARLGYSHVNHFNAAFKKKFGYPPGAFRKGALK